MQHPIMIVRCFELSGQTRRIRAHRSGGWSNDTAVCLTSEQYKQENTQRRTLHLFDVTGHGAALDQSWLTQHSSSEEVAGWTVIANPDLQWMQQVVEQPASSQVPAAADQIDDILMSGGCEQSPFAKAWQATSVSNIQQLRHDAKPWYCSSRLINTKCSTPLSRQSALQENRNLNSP
jgi:hypothetical protein